MFSKKIVSDDVVFMTFVGERLIKDYFCRNYKITPILPSSKYQACDTDIQYPVIPKNIGPTA